MFQFARMIERSDLVRQVLSGLKSSPITALLGPRQCGKTTLARVIAQQQETVFFDLEDPESQARLSNPKLALEGLRGVVIIDEIQRQPGLMGMLRVLADRNPLPARFLILGSASPDLMRQASESLAGRVLFVDMSGLSLREVGDKAWKKLWLRGGFPPAFLAESDRGSLKWRQDFIRTFLERDLPQLGVRVPGEMLRRFWTMVAHYHGQIWNASEIGASLGVSHHTTRHYLDLLTGAFVLRQLPPWFENVGKRVVKSPKVYIRDSGIFHALMGVEDEGALQGHPKLGASWEGFALEQVLGVTDWRNAYFWATQSRAELDLLLLAGGKRWGFEFKYADAPVMTKSLHIAVADLKVERAWVVYPGQQSYPLAGNVEVVPLATALQKAASLG